MNFLAIVLTAVLFTLKLLGKITVSWLIVFAPIGIAIIMSLVFVLLAAAVAAAVNR